MHRLRRLDRWSLWMKVSLAIALVLTFGLVSATAGQLQIGPNASGPYSGTFFNNETNDIGNGQSLYVFHTSASGDQLNLPTSGGGTTAGFLLLLGIPNNDTTNLGSITSSNGALATTDYFGGTWNSSGFAGSMTSGDAYSQANLPGANNSNNFSNWSTWDNHIGVSASSFGIYVYQINSTIDGGSNKSVNVTFSSLPLGTFVIGYGVVDPSGKLQGNNVYATPFTQAGIVTSGGGTVTPPVGTTPAPPSIVLMGLGGLGMMFKRLRSRRRLAAAA